MNELNRRKVSTADFRFHLKSSYDAFITMMQQWDIFFNV